MGLIEINVRFQSLFRYIIYGFTIPLTGSLDKEVSERMPKNESYDFFW